MSNVSHSNGETHKKDLADKKKRDNINYQDESCRTKRRLIDTKHETGKNIEDNKKTTSHSMISNAMSKTLTSDPAKASSSGCSSKPYPSREQTQSIKTEIDSEEEEEEEEDINLDYEPILSRILDEKKLVRI